MKRKSVFLVLLFLCTCMVAMGDSPKREFRATWFTTHYGIDWPSTKATSAATIKQQKKEMTDVLDQLQAGNLNAACFQVRPVSDAFYQSSYEPWSHILTGKRGQNPGYDPLAYAVEQAHARGMELHAWVNPFRYEITAGERATAISNGTALAGSDPIRANHPDWLLTYNNGTFKGTILDPGNPSARAYVVKVLMEIVQNYDIDGLLMDDYFYAYGGTTSEDAASMSAYKPASQDVADWRRENVNKVIKAVYDSIQVVKPWVKFGMAPGGIYSMTASAAGAYGLSLPSGISGGDVWATLYCDPLAWVNGGYVDYLAPQVYWSTTAAQQDYDVLCQWWGESIAALNARRSDGKRVHSFISQASYRFGPSELGAEINANRLYAPYDAPGSIFYNTNTYLKLTSDGSTSYSCRTLAGTHFTQKALPPAVTWKAHASLQAPTDLVLSGTTLSWQHDVAERFSVYVYPKGKHKEQAIESSAYLVGMVYGKQVSLSGVSGLQNMTIAVRAMDRYGNEYDAATLNEGEPEPQQEPAEGTLSRVQLWQKSAAQLGFMATNANRSIACNGDKVYVSDGAGYHYYVLDATTGALEQTVDLSSEYFVWHNLRFTDDGTMLLGNSGTGSNNQYVYTVASGSGNASLLETYNAAGFGRCDYFYPFGEFSSSGYLLMLSNVSNSALRMNYANGAMQGSQVIANASLPAGTSAKAVPADEETFFASVSSIPATLHSVRTGALVDSWTGAVKPQSVNVSGVGYMVLGGHKYVLLPDDVAGSFVTYDVTEGLSNATIAYTSTGALGTSANATYTIDFAVRVVGNDAYVYVLAPNNGISAWKYTFTPTGGTGVDAVVSVGASAVKRVRDGRLEIVVLNGEEERVYTLEGVRVQ